MLDEAVMSKAATRAAEAAERREYVVMLREGGMKFADIAGELGISFDRARGLYARAMEAREEAAYGLSTRSRLIVEQCGCSVDGLLGRLRIGEAGVEAILRRRANCFRPQVDEILVWLRRVEAGEVFEKTVTPDPAHRR